MDTIRHDPDFFSILLPLSYLTFLPPLYLVIIDSLTHAHHFQFCCTCGFRQLKYELMLQKSYKEKEKDDHHPWASIALRIASLSLEPISKLSSPIEGKRTGGDFFAPL
jgi:hypothetical protein